MSAEGGKKKKQTNKQTTTTTKLINKTKPNQTKRK